MFKKTAQRGGGEAVSIDKAREVEKQLLIFAFGPRFKKNMDEVYAELGLGEDKKTADSKDAKKEEPGK